MTFVSSARAAAFHALRYFGIREPFKVLVPAYHCGVEIEAMLRAGAAVEYYPVGRDMQVDNEDVLQRLGPNIKALFLIHYWGFPQDTRTMAKICSEHGIVLIEDCAHALFSGHGERLLGTFGDASIYSLPKTLPVPDGGLLRLKDNVPCFVPDTAGQSWVAFKAGTRLLLDNLRFSGLTPLSQLADFVMAMKRQPKRQLSESWNDHGETSLSIYNRGMSGLSRFVVQRSSGRRILSLRRRNYLCLLKWLRYADNLWIVFSQLYEGVCPLFCPVIVEERDGLAEHLRRNGIETFVFGRRLHPTLSREGYGDAQFLSRHVLGLPVHQDLCEEDMQTIAERTREWGGGQ